MSRHILVATFQREEDLLHAVRQLRRRGLEIVEAYTPYPVHGLDEALGLAPSRLSWICALMGVGGAGVMLWFQTWTSAIDWPVNVGGKPLTSLPAFMPVVFESMVLAAGIGTALAFFAISRLVPGRKPRLVIPRVTDDRFAVVVHETDASFSPNQVRAMLAESGAVQVEDRATSTRDGFCGGTGQPEDTACPAATGFVCPLRRRFGLPNLVLTALLLTVITVAFVVGGTSGGRGWEFLPNMVWSPAYDAYALAAKGPGGLATQDAPPGVVARGEVPLAYARSEEDALLAGKELKNPFSPTSARDLTRGTFVFENFCTACHGLAGQGDGPVAQRGYPPPPNLATGSSRSMPDGQLFHIITYGRRNMPSHAAQLEPDDRWKVILHIRKLQAESTPPESKSP